MGIFKSIFGGDDPWMRPCPVCGEDSGGKPGAFLSFYGISAFGGDSTALRNAVAHFENLTRQNPGNFICFPSIVSMYASQQGLLEFRQVWENTHPGNKGIVWRSLTNVIEGKCRHDHVVPWGR